MLLRIFGLASGRHRGSKIFNLDGLPSIYQPNDETSPRTPHFETAGISSSLLVFNKRFGLSSTNGDEHSERQSMYCLHRLTALSGYTTDSGYFIGLGIKDNATGNLCQGHA